MKLFQKKKRARRMPNQGRPTSLLLLQLKKAGNHIPGSEMPIFPCKQLPFCFFWRVSEGLGTGSHK